MYFPDIIYRNNNYVENLHATGNNENKNIILFNNFTYLNSHFPNWAETLLLEKHINKCVISKNRTFTWRYTSYCMLQNTINVTNECLNISSPHLGCRVYTLNNIRTGYTRTYGIWLSEVTQFFKCLSGSRFSTRFVIRHTVDFNQQDDLN